MNYQHWQDISFYLNEIDQERENFGKTAITADLMETTRQKISYFIDQLKTILEQKFNKDHASLMLFAIVAGVDEQMQSYDYNQVKQRWVPLQKDFYSAYTAGEVFFKTIDDILDNLTIPALVYEVFYFILKRGFQGKYRDSKTQLRKYLELLKQKIPTSNPEAKTIVYKEEAPSKPLLRPWHYYALATFLLGVSYGALFLFSNWG